MPVMRRLHVGGTTYDTVGEASVTQVQTSGTKIATVSIDGTATDIYAPEGGSSVDPATATPSMDGTAAVGSSAKYAREDHVHPTDTSRQATLVSGTNIKTINGNSLLGSGNISVAVSMADTDVDAAVEAAWPAPPGYSITPDEMYLMTGSLLGIGLSEEVSSGYFLETAEAGVTIYVLTSDWDWHAQATEATSSNVIDGDSFGPSAIGGGVLFTFTMPADDVEVSCYYDD